jgi:hypothetical protein
MPLDSWSFNDFALLEVLARSGFADTGRLTQSLDYFFHLRYNEPATEFSASRLINEAIFTTCWIKIHHFAIVFFLYSHGIPEFFLRDLFQNLASFSSM